MSKPAALPVPPIPIPIPETDKMDDGARASQMRLTYHVHESSATISREPVRYDLSQAPQAISMTQEELEGLRGGNPAGEDVEMEDISSAEAPRSNRPGQAGFAARLMAKYGWEKGSGLGASGGGILKPLQAKVEKQKKRSDAEGGGIRNKGRGTILAESRKDGDQSNAHGKFGPMSEVIVLDQMVDGLDVDAEMEDGLMQEIGEECGEKVQIVEPSLCDAVADPYN